MSYTNAPKSPYATQPKTQHHQIPKPSFQNYKWQVIQNTSRMAMINDNFQKSTI
jgi:hypothetical protein